MNIPAFGYPEQRIGHWPIDLSKFPLLFPSPWRSEPRWTFYKRGLFWACLTAKLLKILDEFYRMFSKICRNKGDCWCHDRVERHGWNLLQGKNKQRSSFLKIWKVVPNRFNWVKGINKFLGRVWRAVWGHGWDSSGRMGHNAFDEWWVFVFDIRRDANKHENFFEREWRLCVDTLCAA